ncbi:MAG: transposase [Sphingobacteriales bacterium]|nr:transposase [Sphingobacteriales bacterium]
MQPERFAQIVYLRVFKLHSFFESVRKRVQAQYRVMWLLQQLAPDHNTIANFRKDNQKAIREVFRHTVRIAKQFQLIGGKLIAGRLDQTSGSKQQEKQF